MAKKTLNQKIDALTTIVENMDARMEKGFAAVADDISNLRREVKGDIAAVHDQMNSIERQLRDTRTDARLADLEEKIFGEARR